MRSILVACVVLGICAVLPALPDETSLGIRVAGGEYPLNLIEVAGRYIVTTNNGYGDQFLQSYDVIRRQVTAKVVLPSLWFGLSYEPETSVLAAADGKSGIYVVRFERGTFGKPRHVEIAGCRFTAGVVVLDRDRLAVACNQSHEVVEIGIGSARVRARARVGEYPFGLLVLPGNRLAVSNWGQSSVTVMDASSLKKLADIPTGSHPNQMLVLPGLHSLAVSCSSSDTVSLIDLESLRETRRIDLRVGDGRLIGVQPNALAFHRGRLFVALAAVEGVAVFAIESENNVEIHFEGVMPAAAFPTALVYSTAGRGLFIASGRNRTTGANITAGSKPGSFRYIGQIVGGGLEKIAEVDLMRGRPQLQSLAERIYGSQKVSPRVSGHRPPIRYVFYVIKENRTYDQVLGDMPEGNGSPELAIFGEKVTPNHHALARDYILFDNFYASGDVSADGHLWSTAAASSEYVNKMWPMQYSQRAPDVLDAPYDGDARHDRPIAVPDSGFLWDRLLRAGVSYRNYGEWYAHEDENPSSVHVYLSGLKNHSDMRYRDDIGDVTDQQRIDEWEREFTDYERNDHLPHFSLIYLPNDHTVGTKPGYHTPTAMMADNDLALGRIVERISRSRYWPQSAILVLEDDAQDGPDHVDAHRSVLLAISPYTRRHTVSHSFYSTVSVVKAITELLGIGSLTYFDDRAESLLGEFSGKPSTEPYTCLHPGVPLNMVNAPDAPGAHESARWDFRGADRAPWLELNRVIWKSVKGARSEPPPSVLRVWR